MPPTSAAGWNTDQMPGLPEPGIARVRRSCQQRVPGHARDRGPGGMRRRPAAPDDRRVPAALASGRWQRMDAVPGHPSSATPGHQDLAAGGTVTGASTSDELELSPDIGDLLREIDRDPIAIFWG